MSNFFNPPAANVPAPQINTYQPTGFPTAESGVMGGVPTLANYNTYAQLYPQVYGIGQSAVSDPNAQYFQQGAGTAAGMGQQAAINAYNQGGGLYGLGSQLVNTAFDPQGALYNRTLQQVQDQTRAANEAAGVATTPYGAGLEGQALSNFNIDWQNNQLQRQLAGAQGAGSAITQGAGLQTGAPGTYLQASGMPYGVSQGIFGNQLSTLGGIGGFGAQGAQIPQQQIADWQNYLGWGTGQQGMGNQAQLGLGQWGLNQAQAASQEQASMFGGLGKMFGGLWSTPMGGGTTFGGNILGDLGFAAV